MFALVLNCILCLVCLVYSYSLAPVALPSAVSFLLYLHIWEWCFHVNWLLYFDQRCILTVMPYRDRSENHLEASLLIINHLCWASVAFLLDISRNCIADATKWNSRPCLCSDLVIVYSIYIASIFSETVILSWLSSSLSAWWEYREMVTEPECIKTRLRTSS